MASFEKRGAVQGKGSTDELNVRRFAPEIFTDKKETRRNPEGFQTLPTQTSGNL